ncbi:MAG: helix-turn-helix transcriptional regulator [Flavipsychrobacter sp.]|nr:helix-turn-helix transcriptional regulator [Flavipsychrobacter sp.]
MKNTIKVERAKLNISQTELAEQVGVSKQTIHSIETGRFVPSTVLSLKIARFFKVKVEEVFELEDTD